MPRPLLLVLPLLLSACASAPDSGFADVQSQVTARTGRTVSWRSNSYEDALAAKNIHDLITSELTADKAVQVALLNNRRLQAAYEDLGVAQAAVVQAGLLKNPVFDLAVKFPSGGGSVNLEMAIVQDFLDIFFIPLRTRIAAAEFEAAKLDVTAKVLDIAGATRLAFLQVQADEQTLDLRKQTVQASEAAHEFAIRMHKAGNLRDLDLASERAALGEARLELAIAEATLAENREKLTTLMGLWGDQTQWTAGKKLPDAPTTVAELSDLEKQAIEKNIDLAAAKHRVDALAEQLGFERSTSLISEAEAGVVAERDDGHWEVGPSIALPIPIFDQGQARVGKAKSLLRREEQNMAALAVEVRSAARLARQRIVAAHRAALFYRDEVQPLRRKIVQDTMLQVNAGQVSLFQLLAARQQLIDADRKAIEALHDYWRAQAQLDLLIAGRTSDAESISRSESSMPARSSASH